MYALHVLAAVAAFVFFFFGKKLVFVCGVCASISSCHHVRTLYVYTCNPPSVRFKFRPTKQRYEKSLYKAIRLHQSRSSFEQTKAAGCALCSVLLLPSILIAYFFKVKENK